MQVDPHQVQLTSQQQVFVARQAERLGKPWPELLDEYIPGHAPETAQSESAYEAAQRLGLIGGVKGEPSDLASNPDHLSGFGQ